MSNMMDSLENKEDIENLKPRFIVSADGDGDFFTISEAVSEADEGDFIFVKSGIYDEHLEIDKTLIICGDENNLPEVCLDKGVVCSIDADAYIENIHFRNTDPIEYDENDKIIVQKTSFAVVEITENCKLINCKVSDSLWNGIVVKDASLAIIDNCDIYENGYANICIQDSANPLVRNCSIHNSFNSGVSTIGNYSGGCFLDCNIYENNEINVVLEDSSNPYFNNCDIYCSYSIGVFTMDYAAGFFINCNIHDNEEGNISNVQMSNTIFRKCDIYDSKQHGVYLEGKSIASYTDCEIHGNLVNVIVSENSMPFIKKSFIYDAELRGIDIESNSICNVVDCELKNNEINIKVEDNSFPVVDNCCLSDSEVLPAITTCNTSKGFFKNCEITRNFSGVNITENSSPLFIEDHIHDNSEEGVLIEGKNHSLIYECDLDSNECNLKASGELYSDIIYCKVRNGREKGICVENEFYGSIKDCNFSNNADNHLENNATVKPYIFRNRIV